MRIIIFVLYILSVLLMPFVAMAKVHFRMVDALEGCRREINIPNAPHLLWHNSFEGHQPIPTKKNATALTGESYLSQDLKPVNFLLIPLPNEIMIKLEARRIEIFLRARDINKIQAYLVKTNQPSELSVISAKPSNVMARLTDNSLGSGWHRFSHDWPKPLKGQHFALLIESSVHQEVHADTLRVIAPLKGYPNIISSPATRHALQGIKRKGQFSNINMSSVVVNGTSKIECKVFVPKKSFLEGYISGTGSFRIRIKNKDGDVYLEKDLKSPKDKLSWEKFSISLEGIEGNFYRLEFLTGGEGKHIWGNPYVMNIEKSPRSIYLFTIDSLREDLLATHGGDPRITPHLNRFTRHSLDFKNVLVHRGQTWVSLTSLLTGIYPLKSGVYVRGQNLPLNNQHLLPQLRKAGYLIYTFGDMNFPDFYFAGVDFHFVHTTDSTALKDFHAELPNMAQRLVFSYFHLAHTHYPYHPSPAFNVFDPDYQGPMKTAFTRKDHEDLGNQRRKFSTYELNHIKKLYFASVREVDFWIGKILQKFFQMKIFENSILSFTSDHGESLGENDIWFEHSFPEDSILIVPWLLHDLKNIKKPKMVNALVEFVDIIPTMMALAGIDLPKNIDGENVLPQAMGKDFRSRVAISSIEDKIFIFRNDRWNFIYNPYNTIGHIGKMEYALPMYSLFDLRKPLNDRENVASRYPLLIRRFVQKVEAFKNLSRIEMYNQGLDQETRKLLQDAGYLEPDE